LTAEPYPLYLQPHLSRRLWGDASLETYLGLEPAGPGDPWGESWQVWAGNRIVNGPLAGSTLQEAADLWGERLLGSLASGSQVPLLVKFIAAGQDLSLQVHPADDYALARHGQPGKAEAWLILRARPGAFVYWGFKETVSAAAVREAAAAGTLAELLNRVPVTSGDVIYNPPGTVHAIGAGIILYEIQQSSDLTFRLYDYGRHDSYGNLRELHLDEGLAVADLTGGESAKVLPRELESGGRELIVMPHFVLTSSVQGQYLHATEASLQLLTAVEGDITLRGQDNQLKLPAGTSLVLPAVEQRYEIEGTGTLLSARLPD